MRYLFLFFFVFLTPIVSFSQMGFTIPKGKNKVVIPFKLINNLIFIPLQLNGEELTFLVDTGVEETVLLRNDEIEIFTETPHFPQISIEIKGREYFSPDILCL